MIVGVDFGAPRRARDQRRKIIAVAAQSTGPSAYRIDRFGMNERLRANGAPGWSAQELVEELSARPARVVGFDFPFSVPNALLVDPKFASDVGYKEGSFQSWSTFNSWVAQRLPFTDPLDFEVFAPWRDRADRARLWSRRATDLAVGGQPPLKDKFQATFQMTLLGNAVLAKLRQHYRIVPFMNGPGGGQIIEVYPGASLRAWGLPAYKAEPKQAVCRGIDECKRAGIVLDIDPELLELAHQYKSGTADHDLADALIALFTAILYAENECRSPLAADDPLFGFEGVIWIPDVLRSSS